METTLDSLKGLSSEVATKKNKKTHHRKNMKQTNTDIHTMSVENQILYNM